MKNDDKKRRQELIFDILPTRFRGKNVKRCLNNRLCRFRQLYQIYYFAIFKFQIQMNELILLTLLLC